MVSESFVFIYINLLLILKVYGLSLRVSRKSKAWGQFHLLGRENVLKGKILNQKWTATGS
jgi:hypothetical protein